MGQESPKMTGEVKNAAVHEYRYFVSRRFRKLQLGMLLFLLLNAMVYSQIANRAILSSLIDIVKQLALSFFISAVRLILVSM